MTDVKRVPAVMPLQQCYQDIAFQSMKRLLSCDAPRINLEAGAGPHHEQRLPSFPGVRSAESGAGIQHAVGVSVDELLQLQRSNLR